MFIDFVADIYLSETSVSKRHCSSGSHKKTEILYMYVCVCDENENWL